MMYKAGIDIGGTNIAAGVLDDNNKVLCKLSTPFPGAEDNAKACDAVADLVFKMAATLGISVSEFSHLGVAVPGSISQDGTTVVDAHNLGFHNFNLKQQIQSRTGLCVTLCNDANAATLAEQRCGSLMGCDTAVLLTLGTGVGGGLIMGGKLFNGGRGMGVELGHMFLKSGGEPCTCGNLGCVESYCSATALAKSCNVSEARQVFQLADSGDSNASLHLNAFIDDLGSAIASIINLLDPQRIAIGGGVSNAGDRLFVPLNQNAKSKCFFTTCPNIVQATLKNDAGFIGAALICD